MKTIGSDKLRHRAYAEYVKDSDVRYTWPCDHSRVKTLTVGPRGHVKPMTPAMVRKLAHYWSRANNGVNAGPCPTCTRRNRA